MRQGSTYAENAVVDNVVVNVYVGQDAKGELLYLIGNLPVNQLRSIYRKRWTIEVFFQALKGRGFNLERSGLGKVEKMRKLFAVACIAYAICWATAIEEGKMKPVKRKKHGYPQYSVFRRGLNLIRVAFKKGISNSIITLWQIVERRSVNLFSKTVG